MKFSLDKSKQKYGMSAFDNPEIKASPYCSGPQSADQVSKSIQTLLDCEYVTAVIVLRDIDGRKCGQRFYKLEGESNESN